MVTGVLKLPYTVVFAPFMYMLAEIIVRTCINIRNAFKEYKEGGKRIMSMPIIMLFVVMAICFIIRMPVFSMLAASITYFLLAAPDKLGQVFTVITGNMFCKLYHACSAAVYFHGKCAE